MHKISNTSDRGKVILGRHWCMKIGVHAITLAMLYQNTFSKTTVKQKNANASMTARMVLSP
ncbi:unnamed protein product [Fusarium venenatum]|uniref:PiggyBac transposable element-derived protein domain-containing protein n=1 Tax=Fusarium venenatum TaxID=56646 RepID=A0A2L2T2M1_9HYPO|nr:uncharacterized protein FVRRES_01416 [Fusarium venenatum]CEI64904.1 unnamed protein product [Fusarium venenatum]